MSDADLQAKLEQAERLLERDDLRALFNAWDARALAAESALAAATEEAALYKQRYAERSAESQKWAAKAGEHAAALAAAQGALREIAEWRLPPSGRTWEDGTPMSYGAAFGSNGERDYMRDIASAALAAESGKPCSCTHTMDEHETIDGETRPGACKRCECRVYHSDSGKPGGAKKEEGRHG